MKSVFAAALLAAIITIPAYAQQSAADHASHHGGDTSSTAAMSEGEVRKVDMDAKKITLRHGPIANLGMPPMSMVFQVSDPALLDKVKAGDKVRFVADKVNGAYTVTRIESAK
ncbi:MAG: copper-binding protein [Burkholderiales bacterium]